MSASVSAPEPPRGTDQLRPCRPKMIEYALTPEPAASTGTSVWNACQIMNAWTWRSSNSRRITSQAEIAWRRSQIRPRGCSSSISSSEGPKPGGVTRARPKMPLTSSYSAMRRR